MFYSTNGALLLFRTLILSMLITFGGSIFIGCSTPSSHYTPKILLENKRRSGVAYSRAAPRPISKSKITRDATVETVIKEQVFRTDPAPVFLALESKEEEVNGENSGVVETAADSLTLGGDAEIVAAGSEPVIELPSGLTPGGSEEEMPFKVEVVEEKYIEGEVIYTSTTPEDKKESAGAFTAEVPEKSVETETVLEVSNQELIDSALEYWQASNDFWEQGDLESAIDALDQAYELILKVDDGAEPELLQQKEDLRITISRQIIEVYSSRFTVANGTYKAIPLEMNKHVQKAIDLFKGRNRKFFLASYVRSGRYRPAIIRALKEAGLPEELSWLPLIESGFKLRALSSARALGMWQFIASTGYKFGLKRDAWVDERMDPEKSTKAAVAYLTELHQIFGDWTTALAGYNCGENRVLRNIRAQKVAYLDNFWDLYRKLPSETAFYVPKFLAVLHIVNDPEAHGFELPPVDEELKVDRTTINKQVSLKKIAENINVAYPKLKNLNPELRHGVTPQGAYSINIPAGKAELLLAKIDEIPVYNPPVPRYVVHRVRRGESLSAIARRYRTSVTSIMRANGLRKRSYIKVGWKLKVPAARYASRKTTHAPLSKGGKEGYEYTVKRGDSMWKIARKYKITVNSIKALNALKGSRLRVGQVLRISPKQLATTPSELKVSYRVKKGDSPYIIARRHRMGLSDFLTLNSLTPKSTIYPGQTLVVQNKNL